MELSRGQQFAMLSLFGKFTTNRDVRLSLVSALLHRQIETFQELMVDDWQKIRDDAYPNWQNNDWEPCEDFKNKIADLLRAMEVENGQGDMFDKL